MLPRVSYAASDSSTVSRVSMLLGLGQSSVSSAEPDAGGRTESPLGIGFFIDHSFTGSFILFAEHMRSLAGSSTAVGLTGAGIKYYPWLSPAHFKSVNVDSIERSAMSYSGYSPYFGGSAGFAQASIPSKDDMNAALAAGLYINPKVGLDYALRRNWGLRAEFNFSMSMMGAGKVQHFNIIFGSYFDL